MSTEQISTDPRDELAPAPALTATGVRPQLSAVADAVLGRADRVEVPLLDPAGDDVDVVWAGPDDLALLAAGDGLAGAFAGAREALRPGGLVVLPAPTLDDLEALHGATTTQPDDGSATLVSVWEFAAGGPRYARHDLLVRRHGGGWETEELAPLQHRLPDEAEVSAALEQAGFWSPQLLPTADTGLAVAVWAAVAPGDGDAAPDHAAPGDAVPDHAAPGDSAPAG